MSAKKLLAILFTLSLVPFTTGCPAEPTGVEPVEEEVAPAEVEPGEAEGLGGGEIDLDPTAGEVPGEDEPGEIE